MQAQVNGGRGAHVQNPGDSRSANAHQRNAIPLEQRQPNLHFANQNAWTELGHGQPDPGRHRLQKILQPRQQLMRKRFGKLKEKRRLSPRPAETAAPGRAATSLQSPPASAHGSRVARSWPQKRSPAGPATAICRQSPHAAAGRTSGLLPGRSRPRRKALSAFVRRGVFSGNTSPGQ